LSGWRRLLPAHSLDVAQTRMGYVHAALRLMGMGKPADEGPMAPSIESPSGQRLVLRHLLLRVDSMVMLACAALIAALRWLKRVAPRHMNNGVSRRARRRFHMARLGRFRSFTADVKDSGVNAVADLQHPMHPWSTSPCALRRVLGGQTVGLVRHKRQSGGPAGIGERVRLPSTYPSGHNRHRAPTSRSCAQEDGMASWHRRRPGNRGRGRLCRLDVLRYIERIASS
jgi:hypothetical protein